MLQLVLSKHPRSIVLYIGTYFLDVVSTSMIMLLGDIFCSVCCVSNSFHYQNSVLLDCLPAYFSTFMPTHKPASLSSKQFQKFLLAFV